MSERYPQPALNNEHCLAWEFSKKASLEAFNQSSDNARELEKNLNWARRFLAVSKSEKRQAPIAWTNRLLIEKYTALLKVNSARTANIWLRQNGYKLQTIGDKTPTLVAAAMGNKYRTDIIYNIVKSLYFPSWVYSSHEKLEKAVNDIASFNDDFKNSWIATNSADNFTEYAKLLQGLCHTLARRVRHKSITPPVVPAMPSNSDKHESHAIKLEAAILKLCCGDWLTRAAMKEYELTVERAQIAAGQVGRGRGVYVSNWTFNRTKEKRRRSAALMEALTLVDENGDIVKNADGETATLAEIAATTVANPENRRNELMTRIRGNEEAAEAAGHVGLFLTLTAPSKYHALLKVRGTYNKKYQGATPRQTQDYLTKTWAKMRASWKRAGIGFYGVRVSEPHHDATPHWHMLVFIEPSQKDEFINTFEHYACEEDNDELKGDVSVRCKTVEIEKGKSAAGYVAKYISKNIDGYQVDEGDTGGDYEAGTEAKDSAPRACYWAAFWRIRQFQFFGNPSVSVWRALRTNQYKNATIKECADIEAVRAAATSGEWLAYCDAQGGIGNGHGRVKTVYKSDSVNAYGESLGVIVGVASTAVSLITKVKSYAIAKISEALENRAALGSCSSSLASVSAVSWTGKNNCTLEKAAKAAGIEIELFEQLTTKARVIANGRIYQLKHGIVTVEHYSERSPNARVFIQSKKTTEGWQVIAASDGEKMVRK